MIKPLMETRYKNGKYYHVWHCPFCDNKYMYKNNLDMHIRKEHKNAK
jgi:hypothetical protein